MIYLSNTKAGIMQASQNILTCFPLGRQLVILGGQLDFPGSISPLKIKNPTIFDNFLFWIFTHQILGYKRFKMSF